MGNNWIVLASGPNRQFWDLCREGLRAKVFCVNGSIVLHPTPDAYICTDPRLIKEYATEIANLNCVKIIGINKVKELAGRLTIGGVRPYNAGIWAMYLALRHFDADAVHAFGIYGTDGQEWKTLSKVKGLQTDRDAYRKQQALATTQSQSTGEAILRFGRSRERMLSYNENAARCIWGMQRAYKGRPVIVHNGGPISDFVNIKNIKNKGN